MIVSVNAVEAVWLTASGLGFLLTAYALFDAFGQREIVRRLNGRAAELAAATNVRREFIRLAVQALLLFVVLPGLFSDRETPLTPIVAALIAVPVLLLVNTIVDLRDRRRLVGVVLQAVTTEQQQASKRIEAGLARLETGIADNHGRESRRSVAGERQDIDVCAGPGIDAHQASRSVPRGVIGDPEPPPRTIDDDVLALPCRNCVQDRVRCRVDQDLSRPAPRSHEVLHPIKPDQRPRVAAALVDDVFRDLDGVARLPGYRVDPVDGSRASVVVPQASERRRVHDGSIGVTSPSSSRDSMRRSISPDSGSTSVIPNGRETHRPSASRPI